MFSEGRRRAGFCVGSLGFVAGFRTGVQERGVRDLVGGGWVDGEDL